MASTEQPLQGMKVPLASGYQLCEGHPAPPVRCWGSETEAGVPVSMYITCLEAQLSSLDVA